MDEADRILNLDFEEEVDKIVKELPRERRTMLFSATMTSKVKSCHSTNIFGNENDQFLQKERYSN